MRLIIDDEAPIENITSWYVEGRYLVCKFADGSTRGFTGFVEFEIAAVPDAVNRP